MDASVRNGNTDYVFVFFFLQFLLHLLYFSVECYSKKLPKAELRDKVAFLHSTGLFHAACHTKKTCNLILWWIRGFNEIATCVPSHIFRDVNMPAPRAHPCFDAKSRLALGYRKGSWGQQVTRKNVGSLPSRDVLPHLLSWLTWVHLVGFVPPFLLVVSPAC